MSEHDELSEQVARALYGRRRVHVRWDRKQHPNRSPYLEWDQLEDGVGAEYAATIRAAFIDEAREIIALVEQYVARRLLSTEAIDAAHRGMRPSDPNNGVENAIKHALASIGITVEAQS